MRDLDRISGWLLRLEVLALLACLWLAWDRDWPHVLVVPKAGPVEVSLSVTHQVTKDPVTNWRLRLHWRGRPLNDLEWHSRKGWLSFP